MRIGVDIRSLGTPTGRGVSHYTSSVLSALVAAHPDDQWVLVQTGRRPFQLPETLQQPNVQMVHRRQPNKLLNALLWSGRAHLDEWTGPLDVFFAPNFGFLPLARTPLALTVHDLSFVQHPRWFSWRERLWQRGVRPRQTASRAAQLIAVSGQTRDELVHHYGVPPARISVIHSGIDAAYQPASAPDITRVRRKYGLPESYFLFMGAAEPRKNLPALREGFRLARRAGLQAHLVLAGAGHQAGDGIHAVGYVAEADKPALYAGAVAVTLLSHHEGFGFPPLEALACGTPSLVSDLPVFRETLGEAALTVDPQDSAAAAEKLVTLEQDESMRQQLLKRGSAVRRRLTWPACAAATYKVLAEVGQS